MLTLERRRARCFTLARACYGTRYVTTGLRTKEDLGNNRAARRTKQGRERVKHANAWMAESLKDLKARHAAIRRELEQGKEAMLAQLEEAQ